MPILPILRGPAHKAKFWASGDYLRGLPISIPAAILRRVPSFGGKETTKDTAMQYLSTERGFLVNPDKPWEVVVFQFNPMELQWMKENNFADWSYNGVAATEDFYINGGKRKVNFQLQFDITPGALQLTQYHKYCMPSLNLQGSNLAIDSTRANVNDYIDEIGGLNGSGMPCNVLRSFEYPDSTEDGVKFNVNGQYILGSQFGAYPFLHFSYGAYYLGCQLTSMTIRETLFSKRLVPLKATADIELTIYEFSEIEEMFK
jgi:hypothetical protein